MLEKYMYMADLDIHDNKLSIYVADLDIQWNKLSMCQSCYIKLSFNTKGLKTERNNTLYSLYTEY